MNNKRNLVTAIAGACVLIVGSAFADSSSLQNSQAAYSDDNQEITNDHQRPNQKRRNRLKAKALRWLQRTNHPPVAALRLARLLGEITVLPGRVDLDASGSTDIDGSVDYYDSWLVDDDTGVAISSVITSREPVTTTRVEGGLPPFVRAVMIVTDDEGATDRIELVFTSDGTVLSDDTLEPPFSQEIR